MTPARHQDEKTKGKFVVAFVAAALLGLAYAGHGRGVLAHEHKLGALEIVHPWARATAGQAPNGAVYMKIVNNGSAPDRLVAATSSAAAAAELHEHAMVDGVMKMRPVNAVEIPAGATVRLSPGGLHIMLIRLTEPLVEYGTLPLTLTFEQAGSIAIDVQIEEAGATEAEHQ